MKILNLLSAASVTVLMTGCCIFGKYSDNTIVPDNLYGPSVQSTEQEESIGNIKWKEFFQDPLLQTLIDSALVRNVDMNVAGLRVKEAEAALLGSKLGFLPSLSFSPAFSYSGSASYSLPISLNWDNQGLGGLVNRKREAQALASQAVDARDAVRTRMIASLADAYYQLILLDKQFRIMEETEEVWGEVYTTQQALMENGKSYSTSVDQMAASLIQVKINKRDIENQIQDVEYSICMMLNQTPQHISRSEWGSYSMPMELKTGVPASILTNRPDVRVAEKNVEAAYYVSRQALSAMFPNISLSGVLGWTTEGGVIQDPAKMVYSLIAGLAQPIFARGQLKAKYKISQYQQEEAARQYSQTILEAGNEVNNALRSCQLAADKDELYKKEVSVLDNAYSATRELMRSGKASYIEVLVAQNNLLDAQLSEVLNLYNGTVSLITLYIALGGGVN